MKRALFRALVISGALLVAAISVAQVRVARIRYRAIIIGIDKYSHLSTDLQLHGNARIAVQIRDLLVRTYGFSAADVILLLDGQATGAEIRHALGLLENKSIGSSDKVFIFFAGQFSASTNRGGYLVAEDARTIPASTSALPEKDDAWVAMAYVWAALDKCAAIDNFVVIDGQGISPNRSAAQGKVEQLLSAGPAGPTKNLNGEGDSVFAAEFLRALADPSSSETPLSAFDLYTKISSAKDSAGKQFIFPQFSSTAGASTFAFYSDQAMRHSAENPDDIDKVILATVELDRVSIRDALRELFRTISASYVVGSEVEGRVSASMSNVKFETALRTILDQVRATYRIEGGVYEILSR